MNQHDFLELGADLANSIQEFAKIEQKYQSKITERKLFKLTKI